jgi:hypothetical protein
MTTSTRALPAAEQAFGRLIDFAGLFPPAAQSMPEALRTYAEARAGTHAWMLGRFIVPASRIGELREALAADPMREVLELSVIADEPPAEIAAQRARGDRIRIGALEVPLRRLAAADATYDDPIAALGDAVRDAGLRVPLFADLPRDERFDELLPGAMAAFARHGIGAKLRCGGLSAQAFPAVAQVAAFVRAACDARVPFKATAGLHHPVRRRDAATGFVMHGFLNVLAAALFVPALSPHELTAVIAEETPEAFALDEGSLRWREVHAGVEEIARMRKRRFAGYGSCSFAEPVDDLIALRMLPG